MKARRFTFAVLALAAGLLAGCPGDGEDNPFEGSWVSQTRGSITFEGDTWADSDGDAGAYDYDDAGENPVCDCYLLPVCDCYLVTFLAPAGAVTERATFIDSKTLELCTLASSTTVDVCDTLALDKPTLH